MANEHPSRNEREIEEADVAEALKAAMQHGWYLLVRSKNPRLGEIQSEGTRAFRDGYIAGKRASAVSESGERAAGEYPLGCWRSPAVKPDNLPGEHHSEDVLLWMKWSDLEPIQIGHVSCGHWRPRGGNGNFDADVIGWQPLPKINTHRDSADHAPRGMRQSFSGC